ncbi:glycosyl transferase [Ochrobactrum sp. 695/2009]|nr:glycosyl transferase [Ochrobactrum sp. 721/2009]PJT16479.1 glycosyl transferase [Ochrobactrum sp. 720/2009]PJT26300.1 glycosyl transferase [Ochrobactrum sp. 715/2009]PJT29905.1 glycosyl transferase [Ochrobactrum sp. 695/2009]PJT35819.1 glycosyl transferase [Ochrobactrum sp. 689/2009]
MRHLIYLSPLPWQSFAQRPHKFVTWFLKKYGGKVLWLEPYPTRLPLWADISRVAVKTIANPAVIPQGLTVLSITSLPIEPLPGSGGVNYFIWRKVLRQAIEFAEEGNCMLAIGKPSVFAKQLLTALPQCKSLYDAMDDFPAFYQGFSRGAMVRSEEDIVSLTDEVWTSSTLLYEKWSSKHDHVRLVFNGLDADISPSLGPRTGDRTIFGYLGTVGNWFDWEMVLALARAVPDDLIRIIGPVYKPAPCQLPANIQLFPPCEHTQAMNELAQFDVGLIPFLRNELTDSVDPIKYYEYRALRIPVISTEFGEMRYRGAENGVFLFRDGTSLESIVETVRKEAKLKCLDMDFIRSNSWATRFNQTGL